MTEPLPTKQQLLQACRGAESVRHPVLRWAHALTLLHEDRLTPGGGRGGEIDRRRAELVREIDRWLTVQLPPARETASVHTETVGAVVDRVAQYTAHAYAALAGTADWELGEAWERLAELAIGYQDLVSDLRAGRRRLPGGS